MRFYTEQSFESRSLKNNGHMIKAIQGKMANETNVYEKGGPAMKG